MADEWEVWWNSVSAEESPKTEEEPVKDDEFDRVPLREAVRLPMRQARWWYDLADKRESHRRKSGTQKPRHKNVRRGYARS